MQTQKRIDFTRAEQLGIRRRFGTRLPMFVEVQEGRRTIRLAAAAVVATLWAVDDHAGENGVCFASVETISSESKLSARQVRRAIKWLDESGFVSRRRRGDRQTNVLKPVWFNLETFAGVAPARSPEPAAVAARPPGSENAARSPEPAARPPGSENAARSPEPAARPPGSRTAAVAARPPGSRTAAVAARPPGSRTAARGSRLVYSEARPSGHGGRPSGHGGRPSGHGGRPSGHGGRQKRNRSATETKPQTPGVGVDVVFDPSEGESMLEKNDPSLSWAAVASELQRLGVRMPNQVIAAARAAGVDIGHCVEIVDHFLAVGVAMDWGAAALAWRFKNASPAVDPVDGWPGQAKRLAELEREQRIRRDLVESRILISESAAAAENAADERERLKIAESRFGSVVDRLSESEIKRIFESEFDDPAFALAAFRKNRTGCLRVVLLDAVANLPNHGKQAAGSVLGSG